MHVTRLSNGSLFLSLHQYLTNLHKNIYLDNLKEATTLMETKLDFSKDSGDKILSNIGFFTILD